MPDIDELPPDWRPVHGIYLTWSKNPKASSKDDAIMAVISDGTPQAGHMPITVLDVGVFSDPHAAIDWFREQMKAEPWKSRS